MINGTDNAYIKAGMIGFPFSKFFFEIEKIR
jgi:hypothetical protein